MPRHAIFIGRSRVPVCIQPTHYEYRPGRENEWTVREVPDGYVANGLQNIDEFPVVDSYRKPVTPRPRPITPANGAWYQTVNTNRGK